MTTKTSQATISTIGIDIGFFKLELKRESVKGQERSFSLLTGMSALGCRADSIVVGPGVRF